MFAASPWLGKGGDYGDDDDDDDRNDDCINDDDDHHNDGCNVVVYNYNRHNHDNFD